VPTNPYGNIHPEVDINLHFTSAPKQEEEPGEGTENEAEYFFINF